MEEFKHKIGHIDRALSTIGEDELKRHRLRVKTTVDAIKWLTLQGCGLRGHDESLTSKNRGNFIELISLMGRLSNTIGDVVLEKAPKNARYTSATIQKEILHILVNKVRDKIRLEIGEAKFCILVDEAKDTSNKEQMAIVLRFVNTSGLVQERFFEIAHIKDTKAQTLKQEIMAVLTRYNLDVHDLRGQGYDGASNMSGSINGLQQLFLDECKFAYYVHCYAHRLQLALQSTAEDEFPVWQFFSNLNCIVNLISVSPKRHTELQSAQAIEVESSIASGERETGTGANQMGTLHRPGATRWTSNFDSICILFDMYDATVTVLETLAKDGATNKIRGETTGSIIAMMSFDFVFILHLMHKIMGISDLLCKALQQKSLDIVNAMNLVTSTKVLFQGLRDEECDNLLTQVMLFCKRHRLDIPDMNSLYKEGTRRSCQQRDNVTLEHHYRVDVFVATVEHQMRELDYRFSEKTVKLLLLTSALDPKDSFKNFNVGKNCSLAEKFYSDDFSAYDRQQLKCQLVHYEVDVIQHEKFQNMTSISEICRGLIETDKRETYNMIDRLIRLVLTLPVSTASSERAFSAMKHVKTCLRNKMDNNNLTDSLVVYIEREIAKSIDFESIIDEFEANKPRRVRLR